MPYISYQESEFYVKLRYSFPRFSFTQHTFHQREINYRIIPRLVCSRHELATSLLETRRGSRHRAPATMPVLLASKPGLLLLPSLALHHLTRSCRITVAFASSSPQGIANTHRHPSHTPVRPLASTVTTKMAGSEQPRFSAGSDVTAMESALAPLLTANGGRWTLAGAGEALEREFKFKTFAKTWVSHIYLTTLRPIP